MGTWTLGGTQIAEPNAAPTLTRVYGGGTKRTIGGQLRGDLFYEKILLEIAWELMLGAGHAIVKSIWDGSKGPHQLVTPYGAWTVLLTDFTESWPRGKYPFHQATLRMEEKMGRASC